MTWRERRQLSRSLERRVLGGEPKAAVLAGAASAGQDPQWVARALSHIATPTRRRRLRWLNLALVGLLVLSALRVATLTAEPFSLGRLLAFDELVPGLYCVGSIWGVSRYREGGYALALLAGLISLLYGSRTLHAQHALFTSGGVASMALFASVVVLAAALERSLFPGRRLSGELRTDDAGSPLLEE